MTAMTDAGTAWPEVCGWSASAVNRHHMVAAENAAGRQALAALEGITEQSVLGSLARHAACLWVDDWLVVLGAGGGGYPGLGDITPTASRERSSQGWMSLEALSRSMAAVCQ